MEFINQIKHLKGIEEELLIMSPEDLELVLNIFVNPCKVKLALEEITQWKASRLDTMKN